MNIALIFAGGAGVRMQTKDRPKQFLMIHGKPIIVHTIEVFQSHPEIDAIVVVCIEDWITYMQEMKFRFRLDKIAAIVPGGSTGQLSIFNGLTAAEQLYGREEHIVLIHDGVRPVINHQLITGNIQCVREKGTSITCSHAKETVVLVDEAGCVIEIPSRSQSRMAKAPQSFYLKDILQIHRQAMADGYTNLIDSCTMMRRYGKQLAVVEGDSSNIKITSPEDFYLFRALYDMRENQQLADGCL